MDWILPALGGALITLVIGPLVIAWAEVRLHDEQVADRDEILEEWIVERNRDLKNNLRKLREKANADGVADGGTITAGQLAICTNLLYDYRAERRRASAFWLAVQVEERWTHRLLRRVRRRPFPDLDVPVRAAPLIELWGEGTRQNALTFSLDDILGEMQIRQPSRAADPAAPGH